MAYLHERLTRSLLEEMASGVYREGQHFLSMRRIGHLWKVSEPTVTTSLRKLTESGLLQPSARRGYILRNDFQQNAQILLQRNRIAPLKPPITLQQKVRLLENVRGGKIALVLETAPSAFKVPGKIPPSELLRAAHSFDREGRKFGFESQWFPYGGDKTGVEWIRGQLAAGDFHGAVVYCRSHHKTIQWMLEPLLARHLPAVVIYDDCSGLPVNSINLNSVGLGYDAIRQLWRMGHRRITVLVRRSPLKVHASRLKGCLLAHSKGSHRDASLQILKLTPNRPPSREARRHFSNPATRPTAVFACESRLLLSLAPLFKEMNLSVPSDISLLMASSQSSLKGFDIPLDTMQLKVGARIGRLAARLLHRIQAGEPLEKSVLLDVAYIRRGSVREISPSRQR